MIYASAVGKRFWRAPNRREFPIVGQARGDDRSHPSPPSSKPKRNKYNAQSVVIDGKWFASTKEGGRYSELVLLQKGGAIRSLETQVPFLLDVGGNRIAKYVADFYYLEGNKRVVEDAKGFQTPAFKMKWKLCQALHPEIEWRLS